jgi:16S rRNA (uracil1498-N3)-methyltransferase
MQRYFVNKKDIKENQVFVYDNDAHHIKDVMRFKVGDQVMVNTYEGNLYLTEVSNFGKKEVVLNLIKQIPSDYQPLNLDMGISLIKKDKFELIIQKLTELGINRIYPLNTDYSIIKIDDFSKKKTRFLSIAKEASEQSERTCVPEITDQLEIFNLDVSNYDYCFFGYARETENLLPEKISKIESTDKVLFLIGPEGGFSEKEITWLKNNNFTSVSFGKSILRSETAAIFVASVFKFLWSK